VTRSGGLAGFDDHLVIAADGTVTGRTRSGPVACRLAPAVAAALATAVTSAPTSGTGPTTGADALVITVAAGGRTVYLGGSAGTDSASQAVVALLADLTVPAAQRTVCR
jgi:hypothetical protein